ncbi:HAD-IC family P-type ATPase [Rhodoblastus acidophilus]|uniref:P-type Cu(+) transporter n=2 Tax=Rhodoblastus acidophilus TaxID=1074 RepID=A0A6N8DQ63_RHOAC|nr:HAD-IC family P-type ATPase [Rhodoblastus acidophilus]
MRMSEPRLTPLQPGVATMTLGTFTGRLLVIVVIAALAAAIWQLSDILILLFGAILLSIGLCAAARLIARYAHIPRSIALAVVFILGLSVFVAALWVFGSTIAAQLNDVIKATPAGFKLFMAWIAQFPYAQKLLEQVRGLNVMDATGWATTAVTSVGGLLTRALAYGVVALFVAIYLAAQPERYRHLCLRLTPPEQRPIAENFFDVTGQVLQRWLVGQLVVMATIGVLSGCGLWLLGIEAAFALGLMGGMLSFIPYVGAIMAAVPATLVALTQGPTYAASVVAMYVVVHFVEGNFITPMVQAEATAFPPVLAILSTVAFSVLFGPIGVLLAAPLTLVLLATIEVLYVQQGLGEAPEGEAPPGAAKNRATAARAETAADQGLTAAEAADRLRQDGPNLLPQDHQRGPFRIIVDALREPMLQLLLAAAVIYLFIGDLSGALVLLAFAVLNVVLVVVQESRMENALAALKDLTSPGAFVIRDGQRQRVAGADVVAGDIVVLMEGDRVPADARLLEVAGLEIDESLLTGESVPVRKALGDGETGDARPGGDDSPNVWSGSLIVRGAGVARVFATGARTEIGRIGASLAAVESAPTPLQIQTRKLVTIFAVLGIGSSVALAVAYGLLQGDWIKGVLAGITLAMATLPEEFPLVLTVFMVLGAWRMSQKKVLTRRSAAIEALGAVTVLCTDKTGTLTLNKMTVAALVADGETWAVSSQAGPELPEQFHSLVEFSILASRPDPLDPMERAFSDLGEKFLKQTEHIHADWTLAHGYPLQPALLAMSQVWRTKGGTGFVVAAKGAPEAVADLCHLPPERIEAMRRDLAALAAQGLRVLAVAQATWATDAWPETQHDFDFHMVGLVGLTDPLRPEARAAVEACAGAGIRVVMITGDHPATALAIARQAGIHSDDAVTGAELEGLDEARFDARLAATNVFARIMPEQKLRLVQAFAAAGQIVAMTGDGVNDAPSLKAAHIGVAMGGRGTDVAREAASLVLIDDNFASLVTAVRLGRRIADNLRKAMGYILAVHVPIAGLSLLPVLVGWPMVLGPIHVVFLELVIDPVSSIVFEAEPEEDGLMTRPPRKPDAPLFDAPLLLHGLLQGAVVMVAALGIFQLGLGDAHGEEVARCMAFVTLVIGNLGLVLTNRSLKTSAFRALTRPNRALVFVVITSMVALGLALSAPWLRGLFGFAPLGWPRLAEAVGAALACIVVNDLIGVIWRWLAAKAERAPRLRARPSSSL